MVGAVLVELTRCSRTIGVCRGIIVTAIGNGRRCFINVNRSLADELLVIGRDSFRQAFDRSFCRRHYEGNLASWGLDKSAILGLLGLTIWNSSSKVFRSIDSLQLLS